MSKWNGYDWMAMVCMAGAISIAGIIGGTSAVILIALTIATSYLGVIGFVKRMAKNGVELKDV